MQNTSPLLINESPLQVLPSLAKAIGLNEAIVLQQIHYWLNINQKKNKNFFNNRYWTYNTFDAWHAENFSFWSLRTVKTIFKHLEAKKILLSCKPKSKHSDHTKWYSIDYQKLKNIHLALQPDDSAKVALSDSAKVALSLNETETSTKISFKNNNSVDVDKKQNPLVEKLLAFMPPKEAAKLVATVEETFIEDSLRITKAKRDIVNVGAYVRTVAYNLADMQRSKILAGSGIPIFKNFTQDRKFDVLIEFCKSHYMYPCLNHSSKVELRNFLHTAVSSITSETEGETMLDNYLNSAFEREHTNSHSSARNL